MDPTTLRLFTDSIKKDSIMSSLLEAAVLLRLTARLEGRVAQLDELLGEHGQANPLVHGALRVRRDAFADVLGEIDNLRTEVTAQFSKRVDL
jgi:hypothetical protein